MKIVRSTRYGIGNQRVSLLYVEWVKKEIMILGTYRENAVYLKIVYFFLDTYKTIYYSTIKMIIKQQTLNKGGNQMKPVMLKEMPCDLWDKLKAQAKAKGKIFNSYIIEILRKAVETGGSK